MTLLDAIAANRFSFAVQHRARVDICQHVRGAGEIGPRWRQGSNARKPDRYEEMWTGVLEPCHLCGADGGELEGWEHYEFCPSCREQWHVGDYDWWMLSDVLRYRADEAAGLIEALPDVLIVHGHDVMSQSGWRAFTAECDARRDDREGPVDWDRRSAETLALVLEVGAARRAGEVGDPLPAGASPHARKWWRLARDRHYQREVARF